MSDETNPNPTNTEAAAQANGATPTDGSQNTDTKAPGPIPYERFQEVVKQKQAFEAKLLEIEKREQDARLAAEKKQRDELAAQNKHAEALAQAEKELEALRPFKEQAEKLLGTVKANLERRLEKVPDHIKVLLQTMEPVAALQWLEDNADKLGGRQAPPTDAGAKGGRTDAAQEFSEQHLEEVAKRFNIKR